MQQLQYHGGYKPGGEKVSGLLCSHRLLFTRKQSPGGRMDSTGEAQGMVVSSDSAYGSSAEDGRTHRTFPYNEDVTHKVITGNVGLHIRPATVGEKIPTKI